MMQEFDGTCAVVNAMMFPMYMDRKDLERKNEVETTFKLNDPGITVTQDKQKLTSWKSMFVNVETYLLHNFGLCYIST